jgi:hypothetical protein
MRAREKKSQDQAAALAGVAAKDIGAFFKPVLRNWL